MAKREKYVALLDDDITEFWAARANSLLRVLVDRVEYDFLELLRQAGAKPLP